jgi:hypothetical protein
LLAGAQVPGCNGVAVSIVDLPVQGLLRLAIDGDYRCQRLAYRPHREIIVVITTTRQVDIAGDHFSRTISKREFMGWQAQVQENKSAELQQALLVGKRRSLKDLLHAHFLVAGKGDFFFEIDPANLATATLRFPGFPAKYGEEQLGGIERPGSA